MISRRGFIIASGSAGIASLTIPTSLLASATPQPDVWVFHGKDNTALMKACLKTINANGGFGRNAKTSSLFHDDPRTVKYLAIAESVGLGVIDQDKMKLHRVEV